MRAFDTSTTAKALALLLFILLVATASADDCLGYCSGMYMCGFSYCYCPGTATKSSCPDACIFMETGDCSDSNDQEKDNGGLSGGAKFGIFLLVLVAIVAPVVYVLWRRHKNKQDSESSAAAPNKTANKAIDMEQAPPPQAPPLDDDKESSSADPKAANSHAVDVEQAVPSQAPLDDNKESSADPKTA
jgi:hypothetical protein